jgi:hypothetical protein
MRVNKTDRNDTRRLAELARMGWYREANVKSTESRYIHSLLAARAKLIDLPMMLAHLALVTQVEFYDL